MKRTGPRLNARARIGSTLSLLRRVRRPNVQITPPPTGVRRLPDEQVTLSDGTRLAVDLYLPEQNSPGWAAHEARANGEPGAFPTIMCAHPYGKDNIPAHDGSGNGSDDGSGRYRPNPQYRVFRQPQTVEFSAWTGWEAPDPAYWCARGFAVVNVDLRGFGHSEGVGDLLSDQEAHDYAEVITWAAEQDWSSGRVGLLGVSYLAISQYRVASLRPPALAAICPWEGFTDPYRDFARPGGGREDGFIVMWSKLTGRGGRIRESLRAGQLEHPLLDAWWQARTPDLTRINVPMLVCGSFSDHLLHSRGSHEAFRRVGSAQRWLWTHRGGKWATFYSKEAKTAQWRFLEQFVAGVDTGMLDEPPVRLATETGNGAPAIVTHEVDYPPPDVVGRSLPLDSGLGWPAEALALGSGHDNVDLRWRVDRALDVTGPVELVLQIQLLSGDADNAILFALLDVIRNGEPTRFEGSYGFDRDVMTHGQLRLSHRDTDPDLSRPGWPVPRHDRVQTLALGDTADIRIALLPQSTRLQPDDVLRLTIAGRWPIPTNPVSGQFPARYQRSGPATVEVVSGALRLPVRSAPPPRTFDPPTFDARTFDPPSA